MRLEEARNLLGVASSASLAEVKAAYKRKALETHPDRFPLGLKKDSEAHFKLVTEAYQCLNHGWGNARIPSPSAVVPPVRLRKRNLAAGLPFLCLVCGTLYLGVSCATRAYRKQKGDSKSYNPFLP